MVYIEKVKIENFQSHKDTEINLANGLNVITGPSDSGKSTIIRAIKWVLYNEPRGTDFITTNEKECRVTLILNNGVTIIRERTSSKNRYVLIQNGEKQVYEGFGNTVPQEITSTHQIKNIFLDTDQKTSINLSSQLEGPFLLSESGAIRAKAIGRVLGIHYLDAGARKVSSNIAELKKEYSSKLFEKAELESRIKDYDIYLSHKVQLDKTKQGFGLLVEKSKYLGTLKEYRDKLEKISSDIHTANHTLDKTKDIEIIDSKIQSVISINRVHANILQLARKLIYANKEIDSMNNLLIKTSKLDELNSNIMRAEILAKQLSQNKDLLKRYGDNKDQVEKINNIITKTSKVKLIDKNINTCSNLVSHIENLKSINTKLSKTNNEVNRAEKIINLAGDIQVMQANIDKVKDLEEKVHKISRYRDVFYETVNRIENGNKYVNTLENEFNKALKVYKNKLLQLKECPVCETILDEGKTQKIVGKWEEN